MNVSSFYVGLVEFVYYGIQPYVMIKDCTFTDNSYGFYAYVSRNSDDSW